MSNSYISFLDFATAQTYIYAGIPLIIFGVLGGLLNIIVFSSLQIYRQSSSAFYLIVFSIVNIGQLLTGLLSRVLANLIGSDCVESSEIFCKIRYTLFHACGIISPTCLCLATIDQCFATSTHQQWQQWSNIKIAHRLSFISIIFWFLYGIPYIIYYAPYISINTGVTSCSIPDTNYLIYNNLVHSPILMCLIPLSVMIIFGLLAYKNVRVFEHRTVPLVRRRHEMQLTFMVLIQVIFNAFTTTPSFIIRFISSATTLDENPTTAAQLRFIGALTSVIYYLYYTSPFYIYVCVSERFRKQLRYVLMDIYVNRWQRQRRINVIPHIELPARDGLEHVVVESI